MRNLLSPPYVYLTLVALSDFDSTGDSCQAACNPHATPNLSDGAFIRGCVVLPGIPKQRLWPSFRPGPTHYDGMNEGP